MTTTTARQFINGRPATLKRLSLELGGKTPMLVFNDADLDVVVPVLTRAVTTFSGQFCITGSRVIAQAGIADELRERLSKSLAALVSAAGDESGRQQPSTIHSTAHRVAPARPAAVRQTHSPIRVR